VRMRRKRRAAGEPVRGLILTTADRTVVATDDRAEGLLTGAMGVRVSGGRLQTTRRQDGVLLARLAAAAAAGDDVMQVMHVPAGEGHSLTLEVMTLRVAVPIAKGHVAAIVVSCEDANTGADVCRRYRLTPAETSLALELAAGRSLSDAAPRLGIRVNTARVQLRGIFEKTGTTRQAALVRLLLVGA
jgi:DNA-binding CsgD family transcriptional regulator